MRTRPLSDEHRAVAARRLDLLAHELEATRVRDRSDHPTDHRTDHRTDHQADHRPSREHDWGPDLGHTRVSDRTSPGEAILVPAPAPVPAPGRHAARRGTGLVPDTLRGRVALGPAQLTVVAVLVAAGLAVTTWWVLRGDPEPAPVAPTVLAPQAVTSAALDVPPAPAPEVTGATEVTGVPAAGSVTVDVAGRVREPGIVVLGVGARVVDAVEAAGGPRRGVDLGTLNLARLLVDGEQIVVGEPAASAPPLPALPPGTAPSGIPVAPVDLNLADQAQLETLPGVGPVTATAILAWRDEHGSFSSVAELLEVDGIGEKTLAVLTPLVTV